MRRGDFFLERDHFLPCLSIDPPEFFEREDLFRGILGVKRKLPQPKRKLGAQAGKLPLLRRLSRVALGFPFGFDYGEHEWIGQTDLYGLLRFQPGTHRFLPSLHFRHPLLGCKILRVEVSPEFAVGRNEAHSMCGVSLSERFILKPGMGCPRNTRKDAK